MKCDLYCGGSSRSVSNLPSMVNTPLGGMGNRAYEGRRTRMGYLRRVNGAINKLALRSAYLKLKITNKRLDSGGERELLLYFALINLKP